MWDEESAQNEDQEEEEIEHQQRNVKNLNSAMTVKNIHQFLPKHSSNENGEGKRAFRNLEAEEEDIIPEKKSPNFKRF